METTYQAGRMTPIVDLYGNGSPNVVKLMIAMEELRIPWRFINVDVAVGEQFAPDFLRLNPNGRIPVVIDCADPAHPLTIFESNAVLVHLAETRGALLPGAPAGRARVFQWLMFQTSGIGPMFGQFMHFSRFAPPGNEYGRERYAAEARRLCGVLDRRLGEADYLADEYSIADIASYPWVKLLWGTLIEPRTVPALGRWMERLSARPAVARSEEMATDMVAADMKSFAAATPAQMDRFFNRPIASA